MRIPGIRPDPIAVREMGIPSSDESSAPETPVKARVEPAEDRLDLSTDSVERLARIRQQVDAGAYDDVAVASAVARRLLDGGVV